MKIKYFLLSAVLTIAFTLPLFGQAISTDTTKTDMKQPDLTGMLGKPTAEASVGGIHMNVWLMTQDQHKAIMKEKMGQMPAHGENVGEMGKMEMRGMNNSSMATVQEMKGLRQDSLKNRAANTSTYKDTAEAIQGSRSMTGARVDSMTTGTHHIVLDATEIASGKEIAGASATVLVKSPSKKSSSVDLKPMMQHFGGALTLDEKGEYQFTVNINVGGVTKTTQFQYAVK